MSDFSVNIDMAELDKMLAPLYAEYGVGTPAPADVSSISDLYYNVGGRVTGSVQEYIDEVYAGAKSGKYTVEAAQNALNIVNQQAEQGMTGAGGAAPGVVAPTGGGGGGGVAPPGPAEPAYKQDARMTLKAILAKYKLETLYDKIWSNYTSDMIDITDSDAIFLSIREEDKYKERFAGNEIRRSKGLGDLSPATYVALEDSYRQTLRSNGIPADLFDTPAELAELIANDVSVSEFNSRIETARSLMQDAPASVRDQMSRLFSVTEGQLLAYYIDPDKALPVLKEQERAARIGSAAVENAGMQLSRSTAEDLSRRGFTEDEARVGFSKVSKLGELAQTFAGEQNITEQQVIASQFGFDTQAEKDLARRKEQRVGEFKRGGSYTRTSGVTSGSIETGIGKAK